MKEEVPRFPPRLAPGYCHTLLVVEFTPPGYFSCARSRNHTAAGKGRLCFPALCFTLLCHISSKLFQNWNVGFWMETVKIIVTP